jgi:hypothetical protein
LNRCVPHGELLPEPAMAGSVRREAQSKLRFRSIATPTMPADLPTHLLPLPPRKHPANLKRAVW